MFDTDYPLGNLLTDDVKIKLYEILISFSGRPDWYATHSEMTGGYNGDYDKIFADLCDQIGDTILHLCGCGDPDSVIVTVNKYLHIVQKRNETGSPESKEQAEADLLEETFGPGIRDIIGNPLLLFMAYNLDDAGLTEHDISISNATLSEFGKQVLFILDLYMKAMEAKDGNG